MSKQAITGIMVQVEVTTYDSDGKVSRRPAPVQLVALESEIPDAVQEWLRSKIPKEGG